MGEWKKHGVMWELVFDCREGGKEGGREGGREGRSWQWISLSPLSALPLSLALSHVSQICPCSSFRVSRVFCPCSRSSPALLLLLNRWPVGSLTLINLTSIRPEVIGMPRRWLQGSGAAYESPRPLMNDSHRAWNMCVCARKDGDKAWQCQDGQDGGTEGWRDGRVIEGQKRLFRCDVFHHISWPWWVHALHLSSHTFSVSSLFFVPRLLLSSAPEVLRVSLAASFRLIRTFFSPRISRSLETSSSHITLRLSRSPWASHFITPRWPLKQRWRMSVLSLPVCVFVQLHTFMFILRMYHCVILLHAACVCICVCIYISRPAANCVSVRGLCWLSQSVRCVFSQKQLHLPARLSGL